MPSSLAREPSVLEHAQRSLSRLPAHVLHVDLLVFRRVEMSAPSPWEPLAEAAECLVDIIHILRDGPPPRRGPTVAVVEDGSLLPMSHARLDTLGADELRRLQREAEARALRPGPPPAEPERVQLCALVEERLEDVLREVAYAIRRGRKAPKRTPDENPLVRAIDAGVGYLRPEAQRLIKIVARQIGPLPPPQDNFVKSARGSKIR